LLPQDQGAPEGQDPASHNIPYLNLPTFRMVVLADEILESFFDTDLSASFRLEPVPPLSAQQPRAGFLGGLVSSFIATEDNKRIFNNVADQIGKTMGKHQVNYRPSIGKFDRGFSLQEPKARESLLTPAMRNRSPSGSSALSQMSETEPKLGRQPSLSSLSIQESIRSDDGPIPITPLVHQLASTTTMERTRFAIDESKDEGDDDDLDSLDGVGGEDDKLMMDEVDAFLEAHDSGLTGAENEAAKDLLTASPIA